MGLTVYISQVAYIIDIHILICCPLKYGISGCPSEVISFQTGTENMATTDCGNSTFYQITTMGCIETGRLAFKYMGLAQRYIVETRIWSLEPHNRALKQMNVDI